MLFFVVQVLFIDDDYDAHVMLKMVLPEDVKVSSALSGRKGLAMIDENPPDIILLDIVLPDFDGLDLLKEIMDLRKPPPVIMLTAVDETAKVVRALRLGAINYLVKPYGVEKMKAAIGEALQYRIPSFSEEIGGSEEEVLNRFVGAAEKSKEVKSLIAKYAPADKPVLLIGESGTGKEIAAGLIHALSPRSSGPFIPINCGAIPENLLETELFGSERGAFTGAVTKEGSFELASGGTLFLDEIGELSKRHQVSLLRVLEEKRVKRVGGNRYRNTDVRIISATNRNLKEAVREGQFREDLFYRIHTLYISLPPLRERMEDLRLLVHFFIKESGKSGLTVAPGALSKLENHPWTGNVRELRNVIQRAVILTGERRQIQPGDILF